jgi:hypothetical protein
VICRTIFRACLRSLDPNSCVTRTSGGI